MRQNHALLRLAGLLVLWSAAVAAAELDQATVEYRSVVNEYQADAVVEAVNRSTVSAQTSGRVSEILADVNDTVEKGDIIVRLVDIEQRAALERAQASLEEAEARAREARAEFGRVKQVYDQKLVSRSQLDSARANLNAAEARFAGARAELQRAGEQLEYTRVTAPYAGIVLARHVDIGETVQPGAPLMTGVSLEALRVVAEIPQQLIAAVREHQSARIVLDTGTEIAVERLTFFPYATESSGAFKVRAYLPENISSLFPGMFVKAAFVTGDTRKLLVPRASVVRRSELTAVYVVGAEGRISLRQVRVGSTNNGDVEVLAGLEPGESVALDPIAAGIALKNHQSESGGAS